MLETRHARRCASIITVAFVMLLAGCGEEDPPPPQAKAATLELTGTAMYDDTVMASGVTAKGIAGLPRTANNSSGTNQYSVDLSQLTGPYALHTMGSGRNGQQAVLYSVATQAGVANVTPLTTLLFAQLMGEDPETAYAAFGASGPELVTDAKIRAAQAKVTAYLQGVLGVTVRSGDASFITSTFNATPGDPMFDTIQALHAVLTANGMTLTALAAQIAALARLCIEEKLLIEVGGAQREFCPATKTAEREEDDNSIIDYVFTAPTREKLTVKVRGDEILSGEYLNAGATYSCSGAACAITLGAPTGDETRSLSFSATELTGAGGKALLSGVLMGAIPGLELPVLPCNTNKYFVIFEDNTVIAQCVDVKDPFSLGGTTNIERGEVPSRAVYAFSDMSGANPAYPQVQVVTDGNDSVLSVYFYQYDPVTFVENLRFACQGSECNGITLGPVTVNTDLGPDTPVLVRNVTFANTILSGMTETGAPTHTTARLKASFTTVYFTNSSEPLKFPPLVECMPGSAAVSIAVLSRSFNFCSAEAHRLASAQDTDVRLEIYDERDFVPIVIVLRGESVVSVRYNANRVNQDFSCDADCTGVTVSAPDGLGRRSVTFADTLLHEVQSFPLPGTRTVTLSSGPIVFPAVTP
jgi:hypothetical protein